MQSFRDPDVPKDGKLFPEVESASDAFSRDCKKHFEDCAIGQEGDRIVEIPKFDALVATVHMAYSKHLPLVLSPDAIWLCIASGLSTHIEKHSEELRDKIVGFSGKKELVHRDDTWIRGQHNPWDQFLASMGEQIGKNTNGDLYKLFTAPFSTTTPIHTTTANGLLMNASQHYFNYGFVTMCGIPEITLEGTLADWQDVKARAAKVVDYGMTEWWSKLEPILDQFVAAAEGEWDKDFWKSIYKLRGISGGPLITGWFTELFPYLKKERGEITTRCFPLGVATVPFVWKYHDTNIPMEAMVGAMGIAQDPETLAVRPVYGWAIVG